MKDLLVPAKQAVQLKELGFDEPCFGRYIYDGRGKEWFLVQTQQTKSASVIFEGARSVDGISVAAPLCQQVFKWFREKYELHGCIDLQCSNPAYWYIRVDDIIENDFVYHSEDYHIKYKTYEEAELACLDKLIEIVKNKP
jgi:hypothetical protein